MGTTCASFHLHWTGNPVEVVEAVGRAYASLGYDVSSEAIANGAKHVVLLSRGAAAFVSIFDSDSADLDDGELMDVALVASRLLKTGAIFTSLYDSSKYELVVFTNGRQLDMLTSEAQTHGGPLKRLKEQARAKSWSETFSRTITRSEIEKSTGSRTAFAETALSSLCNLIGLPADRPLLHHADFAGEPELGVTNLYFVKQAKARTAPADSPVILKNVFDRDTHRKLLVYPAAWPMNFGEEEPAVPVDKEDVLDWMKTRVPIPEEKELINWGLLSEGSGFTGYTATIEAAGPEGLRIVRGVAKAYKFHNGQIRSDFFPPEVVTDEQQSAYLGRLTFEPAAISNPTPLSRTYIVRNSDLWAPSATPVQTTQVYIWLQLEVVALNEGEWTLRIEMEPGSRPANRHLLAPVRLIARRQPSWLPIVTGLNPSVAYDTSNRAQSDVEATAAGVINQANVDWVLQTNPSLTREQAREGLIAQQIARQKFDYGSWLLNVRAIQKSALRRSRIDHPAVASNVAIFPDEKQATLDAVRAHFEHWLRPLAGKKGEMRLRAERKSSARSATQKINQSYSTEALLADKVWTKLFDHGQRYLSLNFELTVAGAEFPIAGFGYANALKTLVEPGSGDPKLALFDQMIRDSFDSAQRGDKALLTSTLEIMRGREIIDGHWGDTVQLFVWVINHEEAFQVLGKSLTEMPASMDALVASRAPLQAWHGAATWIPDLSGGAPTCYESISLLQGAPTLPGRVGGYTNSLWCANVLRMVAPDMWLCDNLLDQIDRAALECVATVTPINGIHRIQKQKNCSMAEFEVALLPILPVERARVSTATK